MLIDKGSLIKVLRVISGFDSQACAFMGVQIPQGDAPQFHRSSTFGFIQSREFDINRPCHFVSLENLRDLLNVSADVMDMSLDQAGRLRMESTDDNPIRLQVHTVRKEVSGFKDHYLGDPSSFKYPATIFNGFDIRPFKVLTSPPILDKGRLLISTIAGTAIWKGSEALKTVVMQPREAFLRFIAGGGCTELLVSKQGYWTTEKDGLVCAMAGHGTPTDILKVYDDLAGTELTRFPAALLLSSLSNVAYLSADADRVEIHPKDGFICKDRYSNPQMFPHGATTTGWPKGAIFGRTAKFIVDALSQSTEEDTVMYSVPLRNLTYRIVRGDIEVDFQLV